MHQTTDSYPLPPPTGWISLCEAEKNFDLLTAEEINTLIKQDPSFKEYYTEHQQEKYINPAEFYLAIGVDLSRYHKEEGMNRADSRL